MYNEYKVEFRVFRRDGNEYQMRKIPLKEDSDEEARQVLIEMGYIREDDKISILNITAVQDYIQEYNTPPNKTLHDFVGFLINTTMGKVIWYGGIFAIGIFIMHSIFNKSSTPSTISSNENARNYIINKTFQSTPSGDIWYKIEFSSSNYTLWSGVPQYEGWSKVSSGSFSIKENRYTDTGKKYYYVVLGDVNRIECVQFDITNMKIYNCNGYYDTGSSVRVDSSNPWN